jgi:hypothetical protein
LSTHVQRQSQSQKSKKMSTVGSVTKKMEDLSLKSGKAFGHSVDVFYGKREDLETFLLQAETYLALNPDLTKSHKDKILFVLTHFKGNALRWAKKPMQELLSKHIDHWSKRTKELFTFEHENKPVCTYEHFKRELEKAFGDINETRRAERALRTLKQVKSVQTYTQEFQDIAGTLEWEQGPLMDAYYQGLKDRVKDDLATREKASDLEELIQYATQIDDRQYERYQEKKGGWQPTYRKYHQHSNPKGSNFPQQFRGNHQSHGRTNYHWDPMEIDAIKKRNFKGPTKGQGTKCFNCHRQGHIARNCRAPRKESRPWKRGSNYATKRETRNISATIMKEITTGTKGTPFDTSQDEETVNEITRRNTILNQDSHEEISSESSFELMEIKNNKENNMTMVKEEEPTNDWDYELINKDRTILEQTENNVKKLQKLQALIDKMEKDQEQRQERERAETLKRPGTPILSPRGLDLPPESDEEKEHGKLHFSACYDDYCNIHLQDKEGSGWFPSRPHKKGKKNCKCDKCLEKAYELKSTCGIPLDDFEWEVCKDPKCDYHREGERCYPWNTRKHRELHYTQCEIKYCGYHEYCDKESICKHKFHVHKPTTRTPNNEDTEQGKDRLSH